MKKHYNVRVTGHVQGVFFRASTKQEADKHGLTGMVRNEHDGSVYIEVEGEADALTLFLDWCNRGPARARVDQCIIKEGSMTGYEDFSIQRP